MNRIVAPRLDTPLDNELLPEKPAWEKAEPVAFCADWRGEFPDPERETRVRAVWSAESLFMRFDCRFRGIYVYGGGNSRRNELWNRDVAEAFIRPPENALNHYLEFEISPNGDWLDLDIAPGQKTMLCCDLRSRVAVDHNSRIWTAEMAIPINSLSMKFNPSEVWSINLFRIEGSEPDRFYSAWRPTHTRQPNFHIPEAFGALHFLD